MAKKLKARIQGETLTHRFVWHTAEHLLEAGLQRPDGRTYPLLGSVIFAFFALEAYLNTALREVAPEVWRDERRFFGNGKYQGTVGKLAYLAELADLPLERSQRPYQTIRALAEVRSHLVHAKVEDIDIVVSTKRLEDAEPPASFLRRHATPEFAKAAAEDVVRLSDNLHSALLAWRGHLSFGSTSGAFSGIDSAWEASPIKVKRSSV